MKRGLSYYLLRHTHASTRMAKYSTHFFWLYIHVTVHRNRFLFK